MSSRYKTLYEIGRGAYGTAWLVRSLDTGLQHVKKEIKVSRLSDKELDLCVTEVAVLAHCQHPNIVCYIESFVKDRMLSIVMEYADGGDLSRKILQQKGIYFSREVVLDWFVQICLALEYIHDKNILHRDLKTQNIFLTAAGMVKLGDFGIARVLKDNRDHALTTIGTPYYISPEICQKKPYNTKTDMWSCGCVLYEMCLLRVPFDAEDFTGLVLKILCSQFSPVPRHFGSLISDLVSKLLDVNPESRPSASAVLKFPRIERLAAIHRDRHTHQLHSGMSKAVQKTKCSEVYRDESVGKSKKEVREQRMENVSKKKRDSADVKNQDTAPMTPTEKQPDTVSKPETEHGLHPADENKSGNNEQAGRKLRPVQNPIVRRVARADIGVAKHERASSEPCPVRNTLQNKEIDTIPSMVSKGRNTMKEANGRFSEGANIAEPRKPRDNRVEMITRNDGKRRTYSLTPEACRRLSQARDSLSETIRKQRQALSYPESSDQDSFGDLCDVDVTDDDVFSSQSKGTPAGCASDVTARSRVSSRTYTISSSG